MSAPCSFLDSSASLHHLKNGGHCRGVGVTGQCGFAMSGPRIQFPRQFSSVSTTTRLQGGSTDTAQHSFASCPAVCRILKMPSFGGSKALSFSGRRSITSVSVVNDIASSLRSLQSVGADTLPPRTIVASEEESDFNTRKRGRVDAGAREGIPSSSHSSCFAALANLLLLPGGGSLYSLNVAVTMAVTISLSLMPAPAYASVLTPKHIFPESVSSSLPHHHLNTSDINPALLPSDAIVDTQIPAHRMSTITPPEVLSPLASIFGGEDMETTASGKTLPSGYVSSVTGLVSKLSDSLGMDEGVKTSVRRERTEAARSAIRQYLQQWRGKAVSGAEDVDAALESALRELSSFFRKNGPLATIPQETKDIILDALKRAEASL